MVIKKTPLGESDIAVVFFTKEFGKLRATAKNAVSSRKRFGGRLELFTRLKIELRKTLAGTTTLESAELIKSFEDVVKDMRIFLKANCIVEFIDAALPENEEPCEIMFTEALKAFSSMEKGDGIAAMIKFQMVSLETLGYGADLSRCGECERNDFARGSLVFSTGLFLCDECGRKEVAKPAKKIMRANALVEDEDAFETINCLNAFFQYQTGKILKSAKVLESMLLI